LRRSAPERQLEEDLVARRSRAELLDPRRKTQRERRTAGRSRDDNARGRHAAHVLSQGLAIDRIEAPAAERTACEEQTGAQNWHAYPRVDDRQSEEHDSHRERASAQAHRVRGCEASAERSQRQVSTV
jgi:hypothetical protein